MRSPTQRSLKALRDAGWFCEVTEHWNSFTHQRKDLFGFGDILAVKRDLCMIVQTTSGSNITARIAKIKANPVAALWLESPFRKIVAHGWAKRGPRGKRKTWQCREVAL